MRLRRLIPLSFLSLLVLLSVAFVAPARAGTDPTGKATAVGQAAKPGSQGDAIFDLIVYLPPAAIDLSRSALTLTALLEEREDGGLGELVTDAEGGELVPLRMEAGRGSRANSATYTSLGANRPQFKVVINRLRDGTLKVNLRVKRATIPQKPALCAGSPPSTVLATGFVLAEGEAPPVLDQVVELLWECNGNNGNTLRIRT